jgi:mono/diheme cytochrome c family protein
MRFLRDALITILLLGTIAVIGAYAVVRNGGLAANEEPNQLERSVAGQLVRLSIPPEADREANPFSADAEAWRDARTHYVDQCAVCHGRDGRGATEIGQNMYPPVPDLTAHEVQARSDGALYYIIQNGIRWTGMPAWNEEHSPEETWRLVSFIRKAPSLTEADLELVEPGAMPGEKAPGHKGEQPGHRHER